MATICNDTGQGRVSSKAAEIQSNHVAWKVGNKEKRARMRALMERQKYGRPGEDDNEVIPHIPSLPVPNPSIQENSAVNDPEVFDYTQDLASTGYNVQIRIGPNGETIIDEETLEVDRTETVNLEDYTHVVESDHTKFVNSGTYGKRFRGSRWSAEETERFYDARFVYPIFSKMFLN